MASMISPGSTIGVRPGRGRSKVASTTRSISGGDRGYIEHLEDELTVAQTELSAVTSPSIARQHSSRMNRINAENRQLQAQLRDWEYRYDEEVRDFVQKHNAVERSLRNTNTRLEDYATKAKNRVEELEGLLKQAEVALETAETANVQLERRLEIMSDLLAMSPTKIDLHTDQSGRRRKQTRPFSMLSRPSKTASWVGSPTRGSERGESPEPSYNLDHSNVARSSPDDRPVSSDTSYTFEDGISITHSTNDQDDYTQKDLHCSTIPILPSPVATKSRPARRMRRFVGGSGGPRPLILPSTSSSDSNPTTAPLPDTHEATPSYSSRYMLTWDQARSPVARQRASTVAEGTPSASLQLSPELKEHGDAEANFRRMLSIAKRTSSRRSLERSSISSNYGGIVSRTLLEELNDAKVKEQEKREAEFAGETFTGDDSVLIHIDSDECEDCLATGPEVTTHDSTLQALEGALPHGSLMVVKPHLEEDEDTTAGATVLEEYESAFDGLPCGTVDLDATPKAFQIHSRSSSVSSRSSSIINLDMSTLDNVRSLFGELLRSPIDLARFIVHSAQRRMRIPRSLLSVQWWLVGLLWGPMARRRMLDKQKMNSAIEEHNLLPIDKSCVSPPSLATNQSLAYGTIYRSPIAVSTTLRKRVGMAGPGRKRAGSTSRCRKQHQNILAKHNPIVWAKFSLTLAFAIGAAFKSGPGSLMEGKHCPCRSCRRFDN